MLEIQKRLHRSTILEFKTVPEFLTQSIPYNFEIEKMEIYRAPLNAVQPNAPASKAFLKLWEELRSYLE